MPLGTFEAVTRGSTSVLAGVEAFLRTRPAVAALVALGLVGLVGGGFLAVRWYRRTPADRLVGALQSVDHVTVLMHPNPDPDAMGSALGVQQLARSVGTGATIRYTGGIRHEENRAMQSVLGLEFYRMDDVSDLESQHVVLVDHNEPRGFAGAGGLTPFAVVDHHPGGGEGDRFTDVRPEYGSCAAVVVEYLRDRGWTTDEEGEHTVDRTLATALLYAIQSDTTNFTRGCTNADFESAAYVFPAADPEALDRIANPPVDEEILDVRARAVQYRQKSGPFVYSFVGEVDNADALGQAADELLGLEGVTAVVVGGEVDGTLHLSGRSRDDRVHMGETLRQVVEDIPMADAGGHARMGGGQLSLEHMRGLGPSDGVSMDELRGRVFETMASR